MVRVTGFYRWKTGAAFDHEYYRTTHMALVREKLTPLGLLRLESDRFITGPNLREGDFIAATHACFESLEAAQAALQATGQVLLSSAAKYTNLVPDLTFSHVSTHS